MNTKHRTILLAVIATAASFAVASAGPLPEAKANALVKTFASVPTAELSAKAAKTLIAAKADEKIATAEAIIQTVLPKHPAVVLPLISSMSKAAPEAAAAAAGAAAKLQPNQAVAIAMFASKAAPAYAPKIAAAVAKAVPSKATEITIVAIETAPALIKSIAAAVIDAVPQAAQAVTYATTPLPRQPVRSVGSSANTPATIIGGTLTVYPNFSIFSFENLIFFQFSLPNSAPFPVSGFDLFRDYFI